jgi:hypothetical protein
MPPRTLATLAHALSVAPDLDAALLALADALIEVDRFAQVALVRFDARRAMLVDRLVPVETEVRREKLETTFDHLPTRERIAISAGGTFVDLGDQSDEFAPLFALSRFNDVGWLSLRGIRFEGQLSAIIVLYETRKFFGTRSSERLAPSAAVFERAYARFLEQEARGEAVRTLEDVTQRVHSEYERKLALLEQRLHSAAGASGGADPERLIALEREAAHAVEDARRAQRRAAAVEAQVMAAVDQLDKTHIELHRRSESLRQKTRTLYLIERVLNIDNTTDDPRELVNGLLTLVGDDMGAQRCSLLLATPDDESTLYLAAARGIAPSVVQGHRIRVGEGVSGKVAKSREPLLVQDVDEARNHPLLRDEHFTTGSFISFPLVYHDSLVGVVNLTNRAMQGVFVDEDVERVKLLALVMGLVATRARLADRTFEALSVG